MFTQGVRSRIEVQLEETPAEIELDDGFVMALLENLG